MADDSPPPLGIVPFIDEEHLPPGRPTTVARIALFRPSDAPDTSVSYAVSPITRLLSKLACDQLEQSAGTRGEAVEPAGIDAVKQEWSEDNTLVLWVHLHVFSPRPGDAQTGLADVKDELKRLGILQPVLWLFSSAERALRVAPDVVIWGARSDVMLKPPCSRPPHDRVARQHGAAAVVGDDCLLSVTEGFATFSSRGDDPDPAAVGFLSDVPASEVARTWSELGGTSAVDLGAAWSVARARASYHVVDSLRYSLAVAERDFRELYAADDATPDELATFPRQLQELGGLVTASQGRLGATAARTGLGMPERAVVTERHGVAEALRQLINEIRLSAETAASLLLLRQMQLGQQYEQLAARRAEEEQERAQALAARDRVRDEQRQRFERWVSIVATVFLIPSLVVGTYGANVDLPGAKNAGFAGMACVVVSLTSLGLWIVLERLARLNSAETTSRDDGVVLRRQWAAPRHVLLWLSCAAATIVVLLSIR